MKEKSMVIAFVLFLSIGGILLSQSRYPSSLKEWERVYVDGEFLVERHGVGGTMGITADDLEQLTYGLKEIPGWLAAPPPGGPVSPLHRGKKGVHTIIRLDETGYVGLKPVPGVGMRCQIQRIWRNLDHLVEFHKGLRPARGVSFVEIDIRVYDRPAVEHGETLAEYKWQSASGPRMKAGTPSGFPLGEESWYLEPMTIFFRLNRCAVLIHVRNILGMERPDLVFAEALAWGIEYRIERHPKRLGMAQRPITVLVANQPVAQGKAVALAGVVVAPVSSLEPAQVTLKAERTKKEWTVVASRNGRWVKVRAFSWEMETEREKVKLERPVFPYRGELIVPLRQVAEALGIKVEQKGQTIALLPK